MRVLVVDDSTTMRRIIANTLKKLGYEDIAEAGDGTEGLQAVSQAKPGLILTDWNMPKMDGREFVRSLRTLPDMAAVPVLMVTTHTLTEYFALTLRNDWTERMFAHYLSVPFGTLVRSKQGTLVHNLTVEPYRAGRGIEFFLNLINRGVMTTVLVAMLLFISWEATLAVALVGGGLLYLMRRWTYKYALHFGEEYQRFYQEIGRAHV